MRSILVLIGLLMVGPCEVAWAQADSSAAKARIEAIRQRIEDIRGGPMRRPPETPYMAVPAETSRTAVSARPAQQPVTKKDLDRLERRLVQQLVQLLADERYRDRLRALLEQTETPSRTPSSSGADRPPRPAPPLSPDIVRVGPDTVRIEPDTVRIVGDPVVLPPDTVRETTVVEVQRALLDTGVFRAFEVNFASGASTLAARATRSLDVVGEVLTRYPNLQVEIAGHTDAVGAASDNRALAEQRAESVWQYLIRRLDIDPQRLEAQGYGETRPIATNETADGRALNRRVEFVVLNPEAAFLRGESRNPSGESAADEAERVGKDLETLIRRAIQEELERQQTASPDTTESDRNE